MKRATRIGASIGIGTALAPLLPLYPLRSMTRSMMVGGAGDQITYTWTSHTVFGLVEGFRYDPPEPLGIMLDLTVFAALVCVLAFVVSRILRRSAPPGTGP